MAKTESKVHENKEIRTVITWVLSFHNTTSETQENMDYVQQHLLSNSHHHSNDN